MKIVQQIKENFPADSLSRLILVLLIILAVVGAFFAFNAVRQLVASATVVTLPGDPVLMPAENDEGEAGEEASVVPTRGPEANLPDPDPWDGNSRVNVLLLGLDLREGQTVEDDAPLSDAMILLSMDPLNNTAAAIAIPRDMWVPVPGFGHYKINTAFRIGEIYNIPGGGPALASRTVEEFLGVPIHFYIQLDFQAFVDFIDHIGGLKMTFDQPYTLDRRGSGNKVTLEPGTYALSGEYVLAYARDRKSELDDFDRSGRQIEVLLLIRQRILEFDQLPNLVLNAPAIYQDLSAGLRTNMSLNQIIQIAWKAREIQFQDIEMVVIGPNHVTFGKSPDGLDILRPIPDRIRLLRDEVFESGDTLGPMAKGDLLTLVVKENARIRVLNGSYQADLGQTTAAWLVDQGFNVVAEGNVASTAGSTISVEGPAPYALRWLMEAFRMTPGHVRHNFAPEGEVDIVLVLGDDWASNNPIP